MAAKGTKKENKGTGEGIQLYAGLGVVEEIVAINPTNEQKAKLYGYELDEDKEEMEYTGKNDEGDDKVSVDIYFRVTGIDAPRKHRFFLENAPIEFEDENDDNKTKFRWVNQVGQVASAETKEDLGDWFTYFQKWDDDIKKYVNTDEKKAFRKCLKGEDGLMRFLREALAINYELSTADLSYNYKKIFAGNMKELLTDLQGDLFRKFVIMVQVTTKEGENGLDHFEKLWLPNNNFGVPTLPEEAMKHINNGGKFPTGWLGKKWKKFKETHTNYPAAGYAPLEPVSVYNSENDVAANTGAKKSEKAVIDTNADY